MCVKYIVLRALFEKLLAEEKHLWWRGCWRKHGRLVNAAQRIALVGGHAAAGCFDSCCNRSARWRAWQAYRSCTA
jgi:hypothetical protein